MGVLIGIIAFVVIFLFVYLYRKDRKKESKATLIKENAREKVKLACSTIKLEEIKEDNMETLQDREVSFSIQNRLIEELNTNNITLNGIFQIDETGINHSVINIMYVGDDYKEACNDDSAKITYAIGLTIDGLKLLKEDSVLINEKYNY